MVTTFTIDDAKWKEQIISVASALESSDLGDAVRSEVRLLLKQIMKFTPPKNNAQGGKAIASDLHSGYGSGKRPDMGVFKVIPDWAMSKAKNKNQTEGAMDSARRIKPRHRKFDDFIQFYVGKDGKPVGTRREFFMPNASIDQLKPYHYASKNNRGRSRAKNPPLILADKKVFMVPCISERTMRRYVKYAQKKVGRLRSGWAAAYLRVGGDRLGNWVRRHKPSYNGSFKDDTDVKYIHAFTAHNWAGGVGQTRTLVANAIRARVTAMKRRLGLILSGYNKDIAAGMRARSRARRKGEAAQL